ncbi:SulP family inorganic anion transporter [Portibacter marinus]|uniref:SulP family inorganic anion transporter n=1 Tax=Portibacter marinus TaxID=2898660 RepID=UPI001F3C8657|nr:sulfate permease [Portibacter marinus]
MKTSLFADLKRYSLKKLGGDLIAGLTVAVILIPQGMAYSLLAGLKPIYGLYAALVPLLIFPFLTTSKYLSIGPVALMSIIILGGVSAIAEPGTSEYLGLVIASSFIAGIFQIAFSFMKLGNLTNFLSKPVMSGFISAAGVIIAISQLKFLFSLELPRRVSVINMVKDLAGDITNVNWFSLAIGLGAMLIIIFLKKIHKAIPGALIVVILGIILLTGFDLEQEGVPIIGEMPRGLPDVSLAFFQSKNIIELLPTCLIIALIGFVGSYSISRTVGRLEEQLAVQPNRELFALGLSKVIGSFFSAMPSTGSFTRSAINYEVGARTQISSLITGLILVVTLLYFNNAFYYLPEPILAGIVITSVFSLIDINQARRLYLIDRRDFIVFFITFISTLLFGITTGVIMGVLSSFTDIMFRTRKPSYAILGKLENTSVYRNINRYPEAIPHRDILIFRFSQSLYFANASMMIDALQKERGVYQEIEYVIISFPTFAVPDATATFYFFRLEAYCRSNDLRLIFTDLTGPVRDHFKRVGFTEKLGEENFFLTVKDACDAIHNGDVGQELSKDYSKQANRYKRRPSISPKFWE